jgi:glycine oxidase
MADVVIVGAGIIGSAIALELARRGVRPCVLERAVPGAESSSAAAGMLVPHLDAHGPDDPTWRLGMASLSVYRAWVDRIQELSGVDVGYVAEGAVQVVESEERLERELHSLAWQREAGVAVEPIDRARLERMLPGIDRKLTCGLFFPADAQVDPRLLMRALPAAARSAGADYLSGTTVRRIVQRDGRVAGVELEDRTIEAGTVVIAAGAWTSAIEGVPLPKDAVEPARGQMVALELSSRPFAPCVLADRGYLVPRPSGRVLIGSTVERVGFDKSVTAGAVRSLLSAAIELFPSFEHAALVETWSGLRPYSREPLIGKTEVEGLLVAAGHHRNGITHAPVTAEMIVELV